MVKDVIAIDLAKKDKKKNILQKELNIKEVLVVLGVFGVIGVYGYLFVYPKYSEYKLAKDNLNSINTQISEYEARIGEMPVLQDKLDSLQREVKVKSRMLSHNMEDGMFMIGLSKLMNDVSVDLVDYSLEDVVPYETFYAIPTSITVRGDYRHIREIMYYLEEQKNMTQILDYNMETYIPEMKEDSTSNNTNEGTVIVPNSTVYWTSTSAAYHKEICTVLEAEKTANGETVSMGAPSVSGKTAACQVCKPYTQTTVNQEQTKPQKPKADGKIEATFKFIMYSSENQMLELENDDSTKWKPGKYNPFRTTSR